MSHPITVPPRGSPNVVYTNGHRHDNYHTVNRTTQDERKTMFGELQQLMGRRITSTDDIINPDLQPHNMPSHPLNLSSDFLRESVPFVALARGDIPIIYKYQKKAVKGRAGNGVLLGQLTSADIREAYILLREAFAVEEERERRKHRHARRSTQNGQADDDNPAQPTQQDQAGAAVGERPMRDDWEIRRLNRRPFGHQGTIYDNASVAAARERSRAPIPAETGSGPLGPLIEAWRNAPDSDQALAILWPDQVVRPLIRPEAQQQLGSQQPQNQDRFQHDQQQQPQHPPGQQHGRREQEEQQERPNHQHQHHHFHFPNVGPEQPRMSSRAFKVTFYPNGTRVQEYQENY